MKWHEGMLKMYLKLREFKAERVWNAALGKA